jgi:hypothetical protein
MSLTNDYFFEIQYLNKGVFISAKTFQDILRVMMPIYRQNLGSKFRNLIFQ